MFSIAAIGSWLVTSKLGRMFGAIGVALMTVLGAYGYGRMKEKQAERERRQRQIAKQVNERSKIDEGVRNMPDSDVRDRLRRDARD
ncbi:MAG: hypothetical protein AB7E55_32730 [Pigmentiphaga sp.]